MNNGVSDENEAALKKWSLYENAENTRVRPELKSSLEEFLRVAENFDLAKKEEWSCWFCSKYMKGPSPDFPVRMPLFQALLFPGLLNGLRKRRSGCARWLGNLSQYLYKCQKLRAQLPENYRDRISLYRLAVEHDSSDSRAKESLASALRSELEYSLHELPSGVLYGANGATAESIVELEAELAQYRAVSTYDSEESSELIEACEFHYKFYREYLQSKESWATYRAYLATEHDDQWPAV